MHPGSQSLRLSRLPNHSVKVVTRRGSSFNLDYWDVNKNLNRVVSFLMSFLDNKDHSFYLFVLRQVKKRKTTKGTSDIPKECESWKNFHLPLSFPRTLLYLPTYLHFNRVLLSFWDFDHISSGTGNGRDGKDLRIIVTPSLLSCFLISF